MSGARFSRLIGSGLILVGIAGLGYGIFQAIDIGTCASGGPYVSARPCPEGTFIKTGLPIGIGTVALTAGIFALVGSAFSTLFGGGEADPRANEPATSIAPISSAQHQAPTPIAPQPAPAPAMPAQPPTPREITFREPAAQPSTHDESQPAYDDENLDPLAGN